MQVKDRQLHIRLWLRLFLVDGRNKMLEIFGKKNSGRHIANHKKIVKMMEFLVRLHQELCAASL